MTSFAKHAASRGII
jgi:hypothetical protein